MVIDQRISSSTSSGTLTLVSQEHGTLNCNVLAIGIPETQELAVVKGGLGVIVTEMKDDPISLSGDFSVTIALASNDHAYLLAVRASNEIIKLTFVKQYKRIGTHQPGDVTFTYKSDDVVIQKIGGVDFSFSVDNEPKELVFTLKTSNLVGTVSPLYIE